MSWLISQAMMKDYASSHSLQGPAAEYLEGICSDGEQSAPLSGNHTQQAYCAPDKMTDFSRLSRFGMTFKPLTESLGKELLTLYLAAFPAKTLAAQGEAQELTESGQECGEKWHASFAKYDPDSRLWKTHQCSLLGDLDEFSETWPQWGLMRDGECWEQQTLEQTIRGIGFGLSPDGIKTFHTPNTRGLDGGSNSRKALKKKADQWPTVTARDYRGTFAIESPAFQARQLHLRGVNLVEELQRRNGGAPGMLNPDWAEWLMGWPLGWTELKPLETDKCHSVQQQHGKS